MKDAFWKELTGNRGVLLKSTPLNNDWRKSCNTLMNTPI